VLVSSQRQRDTYFNGQSLSKAKTVAVIFGKDIEPLIEASADSIIIAAKAVHNPTAKAQIDGVKSWLHWEMNYEFCCHSGFKECADL